MEWPLGYPRTVPPRRTALAQRVNFEEVNELARMTSAKGKHQARQEAALKRKAVTEQNAKQEAEWQAKAETQQKAKQEAALKAKAATEQKAKQEAEQEAKQEAETELQQALDEVDFLRDDRNMRKAQYERSLKDTTKLGRKLMRAEERLTHKLDWVKRLRQDGA